MGGGGQAVQAALSSPPRPGYGSGSVINQFLLQHNLRIFSHKRYKHPLSKGWEAVQAGLSCPPISDPTEQLKKPCPIDSK